MQITLPTGVNLRPIPVSPNDDYMAGDDGQIYSRTKYAGFGRKHRVDWYPLSPRIPKGKGYKTVSLCHENRKITKSVHKLVCLAFHGAPPTPTAQVRHLNGDALNCAPTNLAWGTQRENWADRRAHGRVALGEKHHSAKLTDAEREHLRWALAKGLCSQRQAARMLGISQSSVQAIVRAGRVSG
jgi:hypothetical protein